MREASQKSFLYKSSLGKTLVIWTISIFLLPASACAMSMLWQGATRGEVFEFLTMPLFWGSVTLNWVLGILTFVIAKAVTLLSAEHRPPDRIATKGESPE